MPFLREAPDNTLAQTLGNLGSSLTEAWNPLNQIRAQDMLSQMKQRQFDYEKAQRDDQRYRDAAQSYRTLNPFHDDPATLELNATNIAGGHLDMDGIIKAAKDLNTWRGNQAAVALMRSDPEMQSWSAADRATAEARVLSGETDLATLKKNRAEELRAINQTDTTLEATKAARGSSTTLQAILAAQAAAAGLPADASKLAAQGTVLSTPSPTTLNSPDTTRLTEQQSIGGITPPAGKAPTSELQPLQDKQDIQKAGAIKQAEAEGQIVGSGIAPDGRFLVNGVPRGWDIHNPLSADLERQPAPAEPPQDVSTVNKINPAAQPVPVVRNTPGGGAIIGQTPTEAAQNVAVDKGYQDQLQEAVDGGVAGKKMLVVLQRLSTLAKLINNPSGVGQIPVAVESWLAEHGLVPSDRAGLLAAMKSEFKAQIPELRKEMGVKFEAGPELSAQSQMVGDPSLPLNVLESIFARQAAYANLSIQRRELAMRALYPGAQNPLSKEDYLKEEAKVYDSIGEVSKKALTDFGAIGAELPPLGPRYKRNAQGQRILDTGAQ